MNEPFNLRDFLLKLKDYTNETTRCRLHDILQQQLRSDFTTGDALNVLELLWNQKKINEQDFDIVIEVLHNMNYLKAVQRLEEYRANQQKNVKIKMKESNDDVKSSQSSSIIEKICQLKITKFDMILIIFNILIISASFMIYILDKKFPVDNKLFEEIIVIKEGIIHGQTEGGDLFYDTKTTNLHFDDIITRIEGVLVQDLKNISTLGGIKFIYSHNKSGQEYGRGFSYSPKTPLVVDLHPEERIIEVITYEEDRIIVNAYRNITPIIVGIHFKTNKDKRFSFGVHSGKITQEKVNGYFIGFVYGKSGGYIDCLRFVWYKYTSKNSIIPE